MIKLRKLIFKESIDAPPVIHNVSGGKFSLSFISFIKNLENNGRYGFKNGKWYPHVSPEGGLPTIAYGHKLKPGEDYSQGITDREADKLLEHDLEIAKYKVVQYHQKWVSDYIKRIKQAYNTPGNKYYEFSNSLTPENQIFKLDEKQIEMLTEFVFNLGSLSKFPKFASAVFRHDWEEAKKEGKRSYSDSSGHRKELTSRNQSFYSKYL